VPNQIDKKMTSNNKLADLRRGESETATFATCKMGGNRSTRGDDQEFKVSRVEKQCTNDEPRLPKGYRHIRSAIEAVLECSANAFQADLHSRTRRSLLNPKQRNKKHGEKNK
jgi:hypothetical protein